MTIAVSTTATSGTILIRVADTVIPEAFERTRLHAGLLAALGPSCEFIIPRA